jgi:hypothetical protein
VTELEAQQADAHDLVTVATGLGMIATALWAMRKRRRQSAAAALEESAHVELVPAQPSSSGVAPAETAEVSA